MRAIWREAGDGAYGAIIRTLILTGQRREEVGGMRWGELDLEAGEWQLPPERTKNKRPHTVPLSQQAIALLEARRGAASSDLVFGNGVPFSAWSQSKKRLDGRCGVPGWRVHDLRHSFVTLMAEEGIAFPHVIEALVNHQSGHKAGVAGRYNAATYAAERARAMQRWADFILEAEPARVVPIRA